MLILLCILIITCVHSLVLLPSSSLPLKATTTSSLSLPSSRFAIHARNNKYSKSRRNKLGLDEDDDEYDLDQALDRNTDPLISKILGMCLMCIYTYVHL